MAGFNKVVLMGRTTSVPELKQTPSGVSVTRFNLAIDRGFGDNKQTDFIPVVAWRGTAETISKFVGKGDQILVSGSLQTMSWEDNEGNKHFAMDVIAAEFAFCESRKSSSENPPAKAQNATQGEFKPSATHTQANFEQVDEDLPF